LLVLGVACAGAAHPSAGDRDTPVAGAGGEAAAAPASDVRPYRVDVPSISPDADRDAAPSADRSSAAAGGATGDEDASPALGSAGQSPGDAATEPHGEPHERLQTVKPVSALSGVVADPQQPDRLYAFLTFDLRELPDDIVKLDHAVAHSGDYLVQAPVPVFEVSFEELASATAARPAKLTATLPVGMTGDQLIPQALWPVLAADYAARDRRPYAQFRFDLPSGTSAAAVGQLLTQTSLELDYFVP
jgi:hypothetical protein